MLKQLQAWASDDIDLDDLGHLTNVITNLSPKLGTFEAISNIGENIASAITTLRAIPESSALKATPTNIFQGELQLQSGLGFSFTKEWSQYWVQVDGFQLTYRLSESDPKPLGRFPIAFIIDPQGYLNLSSVYGTETGTITEKHQLEKKEYGEFSQREVHENFLKLVTSEQIIMCRFATAAKKQMFFRLVQDELCRLFGDEMWQAKLNAALQVQPIIKKQIFLQYYHLDRILQSLENAGMISAASSMLASSSKKFQGVVTIDDNFNGIILEPTSYFMVLYDQTLYWFRSSSSLKPESFVPLTAASIRFDDDRIRCGQWSFILEAPIRRVTITTRHPIALCEWVFAIQEVINELSAVNNSAYQDVILNDGKPCHVKKLSTFSTMWKGISIAHKHQQMDSPLIDIDPQPDFEFLHDISRYLQHVISLRSQGYTFAELISSSNAIQGFHQFLSSREDHNMLDCLAQIKCTPSTDKERIRDIVKKYICSEATERLTSISPSVLSKIESKAKNHEISNDIFIDLEKALCQHFESVLEHIRGREEFRHFVQNQLQISCNDSSFDNESSKLALVITLKGERSQTVYLDPEKSSLTIGRDPSNDLVITDKHVSRSHIRLVYGKEHMELHDLGSSVGVLVNGRRVQYCSLLPGDQFVIGTTEIRFELQEPKLKRGIRALYELLKRRSQSSQ